MLAHGAFVGSVDSDGRIDESAYAAECNAHVFAIPRESELSRLEVDGHFDNVTSIKTFRFVLHKGVAEQLLALV